MARQSRKESRASRRRGEAAVKLLVVGCAFLFAPVFLGSSPFGKALSALMPIGLLMMAAGGEFLWLSRKESADGTGNGGAADSVQRPLRRSSFVPPPVDRTSTEFERLSGSSTAQSRPTTWSTEVFDAIEWRRFEAVVETLFQQAGFETKSQSHGADDGVDIWLYSRSHPGEPVSLVQCKHWQGKRVGVDKIRELRGVMAARNVRRGQFATTSTFTPDAKAFANSNGINLLDVNGLMKLIDRRTPDQQRALLDVALQGEYWKPTCVNCGVKMVDRAPRKGGTAFWGCKNFPRCKTTMPMRAA